MYCCIEFSLIFKIFEPYLICYMKMKIKKAKQEIIIYSHWLRQTRFKQCVLRRQVRARCSKRVATPVHERKLQFKTRKNLLHGRVRNTNSSFQSYTLHFSLFNFCDSLTTFSTSTSPSPISSLILSPHALYKTPRRKKIYIYSLVYVFDKTSILFPFFPLPLHYFFNSPKWILLTKY